MHPLAALVLLLQSSAPVDPVKDLGSSDPSVRLAAVRVIADQGHAEAEKMMLKALGDDDWEIATIAAAALPRTSG